jgi:AraC-like DNA-binding protein
MHNHFSAHYSPTVTKAKAFINGNIETATPENVSEHCGYSLRQLTRIFEMMTGATLGEFLRWTRLSKALYELKYSGKPILDIALAHKYESQEAFTRIFKDTFGFAPGEYRKSDAGVNIKGNTHLHSIIEEVSHEAAAKGLYKMQDVDVWHVIKPARIWINIDSNVNNLPPHEFWNSCNMVMESEFDAIIPSEYLIGYDAAYLTMIQTDQYMRRASWGLAVDGGYNLENLRVQNCPPFRIVENNQSCDINSLNKNGYDIFKIPESKYIVFSVPKGASEDHGSVIRSIWDATDNFNYAECGLVTNLENAPIYEIPTEYGETVWYPVRGAK